MKIYLYNGEAIDDGRCPRSIQEMDGWYSGKTVEDRHKPTPSGWGSVIAVAVLCVVVIALCTSFAAEKPPCSLECRGMTTTLTTKGAQ